LSREQRLDSVLRDRVLVFGSLPPQGRDIDLLARPAEHRVIAATLRADGFLDEKRRWAAFRGCSAEAIELVPSEAWNLPPEEVVALFADGLPLDGLERLVRPAPHHALLIAARRLARTGGFSDKQLARVEAACAENANCWQEAREHARSWRADAELALLQNVFDHGGSVTRRARLLAIARSHASGQRAGPADYLRAARIFGLRGRRGAVISISGCDGAGKSSQARSLQEALETTGFEAVVVWRPLGHFGFLTALSRPAKRLLRVYKRRPFKQSGPHSSAGSIMSTRSDATGPAAGIFRNVWVTVIALLNAISQRTAVSPHVRRGRIVILDRSALDAIVLMRYLYGEGHGFRFQRWLLQALPHPISLGFLLDVAPATLLARKQDWWNLEDLQHHALLYREECARFGALRLDGELPQDQICTMIATEVWRTVTGEAHWRRRRRFIRRLGSSAPGSA
jgi:thymidylate kinase